MEILNRIEARFPDSYRNGNVLMIHGDCMDVMAHIQDNEAELSCVDPPYGIGDKFKGGKTGKMNFNEIVNKEWDYAPGEKYFNELVRVSKNQIIWGGNYFNLPPTRCFIVWDKLVSEEFSLAMAEFAWTSFDRLAKIFRLSTPKTGNKIHPTQKPIALYKWLLKNYAKPAELILDTHGGSGSIVIACHDLGHPIIWVEKDADYYRDAVARYKTHASQAVLFEPVEIIKEQKLFEV
jgi:site-specific DNA-methyltransferase (adenine-specific)